MNRRFDRSLLLVFLLGSFAICAFAQKGGGGGAGGQAGQAGQAAPAAQGSGSGAGLQGLSFTPNQWPYMDLPNPADPDWSWKNEGRVVVCYRLAKGNSATQPFVLEPISKDDVPYSGFERPCGEKSEGDLASGDYQGREQCKHKNEGDDAHWTPCTEFQKSPPALRANQMLVVGIDISDLGAAGPDSKLELTGPNQNQLKLFNLNVTNQQGSPLNPAPVRASFPLASAAGGGSGTAGALGIARTDTGGDRSGWQWTYMGSRAPGGATPAAWVPKHNYVNGEIISDATGRDFYRLDYFKPKRLGLNASAVDKRKCDKMPPDKPVDGCYYSGPWPQDPFPPEQTTDRIIDGEVVWQEISGPSTKSLAEATLWQPGHDQYANGATVCVLRREHEEIESSDQIVTLGRDIRNEVKGHSLDANTSVAVKAVQVFDKENNTPAQRKILTGKCDDAEELSRHTSHSDRQEKWRIEGQFHLHYYFAVKAGKSGEIPQDPFSIDYLPRTIYLPWPYLLPGDVIPTFSVNLVYTPPTPGAPWQGNTFYPSGSVVIPGTGDGHYYTALTGGFSALEPREPKFPIANPEEGRVPDEDLEWLDAGTSAPTIPSSPATASSQATGGAGPQGAGGGQGGGKPMLWMPMTHFSLGDTVVRPESGHYFTMVESDSGVSGAIPTNNSGGQPRKDPFPPSTPAPSSYIDGQIVWTQTSSPCPACSKWLPNQQYSVVSNLSEVGPGGAKVTLSNQAIIGGAPYVMTGSMNPSGTSSQTSGSMFGVPDPAKSVTDNQIEWRNEPDATSGQAWKVSTSYSIGQAVCDPDPKYFDAATNKCADGHTFVVSRVLVGQSGAQEPSSQPITNPPATVQDGDLIWTAIPAPLGAAGGKPWVALTSYNVGKVVQGANGQYYEVIRATGGISGVTEPTFSITDYCTVIDPVVKVKDSSVEWQDMGTLRPRERRGCAEMTENFGGWITIPDWNQLHLANNPVGRGEVIFEPGEEGGRYYKALNRGIVGAFTPFVNITPPMLITWQDVGTTAPASVATGQPADQVVSLINLTLPQTHTLARFNISAGAGLSFVARPPIFSWVAPTTSGVNLPTGPTIVPPTGSSTTPTYYYYVPANKVETTASVTAMNPNPVPTPIPTTVATTGAGAVPVAVEPQSECTYGATAVVDTATNAPTAPTGDTAMVYPVYECPLKTGSGPHPVDAVLALTAYIWPVDAEVPWRVNHWRDWMPAPSFALSLTNPTNNFYIGGSNEVGVRNLQVFYAWSLLNQQSRLAAYGSQQVWGGQSAAPTIATTPNIRYGFFLGATFNLSNFVSSLFGGGGGAK